MEKFKVLIPWFKERQCKSCKRTITDEKAFLVVDDAGKYYLCTDCEKGGK